MTFELRRRGKGRWFDAYGFGMCERAGARQTVVMEMGACDFAVAGLGKPARRIKEGEEGTFLSADIGTFRATERL